MNTMQWMDYEFQDQLSYGTLKTGELTMESYPDKRRRTIRVWLPEIYDGVRRFPVLYMHDAQNLFFLNDGHVKWDIDKEMKKLSKEGLEAIIVGIDTSEFRGSELCPEFPLTGRSASFLKMEPSGSLYADFVVNQVKKTVDESFLTLPDAEHTGIGGASMGGLMSHYMAMRHPNVFGKALVFSPAYACHGYEFLNAKLDEYDFTRIKNSRFYLYCGGVEIEQEIMGQIFHIYNKMVEKGLPNTQIAVITDSREAHFESAWNKYFSDAFRYLFRD